ncbi:site-specific integrase [Citricoccus sp. K5]|uniref:tyrosine-type recombinase/integrase n=1 Tax=Citricoccus sp. K5 TaxID=2653135 RepID=UPI0012EF58D6|nr:site-specific integrase [Citricoccus sp. K5]VXA93741.1 conserved hypothetical protein [Citricoccus sp. K5]VXA96610.1 conserved hypothetical protein [Citricoccus sp. K5]
MSRVVDLWMRKDKSRTARYGKGKRWQAIRTNGRGAEEKKSFDLKDEAIEWAHDKSKRGAADPISVTEYAAQWEARQIHQRKSSRDTIASTVRLSIVPALGDKVMDEVTRAEVQDAVLAWSQDYKLAPSTVRRTYSYLSGIFTEAALDGVVEKSPCVKIRLPPLSSERIVPLTVEQVQTIADTILPRYREVVLVVAATGLRPGEWRGLTADRVDLKNGFITVDRQNRGDSPMPTFGPLKTPFSRRVLSVGPATLEVLRPLVENPGPEGLVFHYGGEGFSRNRASGVWSRMRTKLPWAGPGFHQLRHHHASVLLSQGASVVAVARRLGHKDGTETLQTYAHVMPEDDSMLVGLSDGLIKLNRHKTATDPAKVA